MNARELFEALAPVVAPTLEHVFGKRNNCLLSTRVVMEIGQRVGVALSPLPVQMIVCNEQWATHVEALKCSPTDGDGAAWAKLDNSWAVGVGYRGASGPAANGWDGHMVVRSTSWFADFSVNQAERPERGIITGEAFIGEIPNRPVWTFQNNHGTLIRYAPHVADTRFRHAPDWTERERRRLLADKIMGFAGL